MNQGTLRIEIDGEWTLEDWYMFPRVISQVYSFLYSITEIKMLKELPDEDDRLYITYSAHPWRGGYSAVNFYNYLQTLIPKNLRPRVVSIHYSSPGFFELGLAVVVAISIRKIVKAFCDSGKDIISLYNEVYNGMQKRKLLSISVKREDLQFQKEHIKFIEKSLTSLSQMMSFEGISELKQITPNELAALKILLSFYRRVRILAEYQKSGKADFDEYDS